MNSMDMNFERDFGKILNVETLASKAQEIHNDLIEEEMEWIRHIEHNELRKNGVHNEEISENISNISDIAKRKISRKLIADKPLFYFARKVKDVRSTSKHTKTYYILRT